MFYVPIHCVGPWNSIVFTHKCKGYELSLYETTQFLSALRKRPFENIIGKGENAGNQHFHLFQ